MDLISLLRFLIVLSVLIFVHEGGHFLFAKLFGVAVEEFGFGLPPRVWGRKIGGTIYSINLLPIGGFVRLKGEEGETLGFAAADSFAIKSKIKRVAIIAAGALGNFLLAWLTFSVLLGVGTEVPAGAALVEEVVSQSPASSVGIAVGDRIISFAGEKVETADELVGLIDENRGKSTVLEYERDGVKREVTVAPRIDPLPGEGSLGVVVSSVAHEKVPWWKTPFSSFYYTARYLSGMVEGFWKALSNAFRGEPTVIGGPVAIFALSQAAASGGVDVFLQFMALLSLNLVVVNLIPIPALDGGRILFIALEALRGKKLSPRVERAFNSLGFAFLLFLIVLLSIRDIRTFF
ncbi:RIP metalloprotease RseP [Candidatus Saccharibacteria bacterium]|nr:RIP metalloprotease RseP [Candidatus Saccharibacteria bacterium]